ncbi:MAG TPA: amidohydrolase, partial [bacterium]|nr:amidohydrolase [bacterium]
TLDDKNPDGWVPEQKISVEEALRAYTIDAAFALFEEKIKGSLEAGKLADFVMIDQDITQIAPENIQDAKIMLTVAGGEIIFRRE